MSSTVFAVVASALELRAVGMAAAALGGGGVAPHVARFILAGVVLISAVNGMPLLAEWLTAAGAPAWAAAAGASLAFGAPAGALLPTDAGAWRELFGAAPGSDPGLSAHMGRGLPRTGRPVPA